MQSASDGFPAVGGGLQSPGTNERPAGMNSGLLWRSYAILIPLTIIVVTVNSFTASADFPWTKTGEPWVWEITSGLAVLALAWVPWFACRLAPLSWPMRRKITVRAAGIHVGGALLYAVLHVGLFLGLRALAYPALGYGSYHYGALIERFPYELRKDVLTYATLVVIFHVVAGRRRAGRDNRIGQSAGTFDILEGSRLIRVRQGDVIAVCAAGNYVEFILTNMRRPLMRGTLTALEAQLTAVGMVRAHRSWLINPAHLTGLRKSAGGGWIAELDVVQVPISRRYAAIVEQLKGRACAGLDA